VVQGKPRSAWGEGPARVGAASVQGTWVHSYTETSFDVGGREAEGPRCEHRWTVCLAPDQFRRLPPLGEGARLTLQVGDAAGAAVAFCGHAEGGSRDLIFLHFAGCLAR